MKRVRITNESVNSYGFRVITDGVDTAQYERNPVLLYMHQRGFVIGYMKDIRKENGEITAEPVFDGASDLSRQCKKQYEFGSLRMVSAGLDPIETSHDKADLVEGQTRPTVTKAKLIEVSLVDIGANDDATVLVRDGKKIELSSNGECILPLLNDNNNNNQKNKEMELKTIALQLGLPETADDAAILAKINRMKDSEAEIVKLKAQAEKLTLAAINTIVDGAVSEKRISADKKQQFVELGKQIGTEKLKDVFAAMSPQVRLSAIVGHDGAADMQECSEWKKLSDVPADKIAKLKAEDLTTYRRLYKAEYGMDF